MKENTSDKSSNRKAKNLVIAEFDPRLKTYTLVLVLLILFITIIGIVVIPFWLLIGWHYINRYYDNLYCELTTRALHFRKGVWFQTERTIPLDKIQDLTFREGPVLRYFGLSTLYVETAGNSAQTGSDLSLTGIINAQAFRTRVLDERDDVTDNKSGSIPSEPALTTDSSIPVLIEIRNSLKSIESMLKKKSDEGSDT